MVKKLKITLSIILFTIITWIASCSFFYPTITVEVLPGYFGWCYVIPIKNTFGTPLHKNGNSYIVNEKGIVYIPSTQLNLEKSNIIKVLDKNVDISGQDRYSGLVHKVMEDGKEYDYIEFYLPEPTERSINDGQYWRDNRYKYYSLNAFDSLLESGEIVFK